MTDRIDNAFAALDQLETPLSWADVTTSDLDELPHSALIETEPRHPRRPAWQPLAAAASVVVLLAGGVWFATRSSDSSPSDQGATTGRDEIEVGVATVVIPDGMKLDQLGSVDPPDDHTSPVTGSDGSVTTNAIAKSVRARLSSEAGTCTITSSRSQELNRWTRERNTLEVERFNAELEHLSQVLQNLAVRVAALNQQLASLPPGSNEVTSIASQRDAALQQVDSVNQQSLALSQEGPQRPPVGEVFTPTDASRTTWRAQATPSDVVQVTCPDPATAQQLVDATTLPTHTP